MLDDGLLSLSPMARISTLPPLEMTEVEGLRTVRALRSELLIANAKDMGAFLYWSGFSRLRKISRTLPVRALAFAFVSASDCNVMSLAARIRVLPVIRISAIAWLRANATAIWNGELVIPRLIDSAATSVFATLPALISTSPEAVMRAPSRVIDDRASRMATVASIPVMLEISIPGICCRMPRRLPTRPSKNPSGASTEE